MAELGAEKTVTLVGEQAMVDFGEQLGLSAQLLWAAADQGLVVFLDGDLGAGKTTLSRGVLRSFGHNGAVKSPTYTLVEPYKFDGRGVFHFDLYRLGDPEELEYMGIRDYFAAGNLCLIEWPNRGAGILPVADLAVKVMVPRELKNQRRLTLTAATALGETLLAQLSDVG